ncbi:MAG: hypothetical protein ACYTFA_05035 [Planctomycetota bacterium]|jgi:hypothetical protein
MTFGAYPALSGLYGATGSLTQGVALGWSIAPLWGLGARAEVNTTALKGRAILAQGNALGTVRVK